MICKEAIKTVILANVLGTITNTRINGLVLLHQALVMLPCIFTNKVSDLAQLISQVPSIYRRGTSQLDSLFLKTRLWELKSTEISNQ